MTQQDPVNKQEGPLPDEDKVIEEIRHQLRTMQGYLGDTPCHQSILIQASKHGWYFEFHSDDHFTGYHTSALQPNLLDAIADTANEGWVDNPLKEK